MARLGEDQGAGEGPIRSHPLRAGHANYQRPGHKAAVNYRFIPKQERGAEGYKVALKISYPRFLFS